MARKGKTGRGGTLEEGTVPELQHACYIVVALHNLIYFVQRETRQRRLRAKQKASLDNDVRAGSACRSTDHDPTKPWPIALNRIC